MNISINDIRRKVFDKTFRGYDPTEVDTFLKEAARALEDAQDRARVAEERVRDTEAKLVHYEKVEMALQEALETARETARSTAASAEEKARLIVQDAELRAETILRDAERERHGLRQDIVRLSSRQAEAAARLRGFLMSELEVLAQFQGDDPVGFIRLQPAHPGAFPPPTARLEAPMSEDPEPWRAGPPSASDAWADETSAEPVAPEPIAPAPAAPPDPAPPPPTTQEAFAPVRPSLAPVEPPAEPRVAVEDDMPLTGAYASADTPAASVAASPTSNEPPTPPAITGGWDLRSLVTGEERSVVASPEELDRMRRILDDLD